jgi:hypothetical protein
MRRLLAVWLAGVLAVTVTVGAQTQAPRMFEQFRGTWLLDELESTGRLNIVPRVPLELTIATTPEAITVTKRLRLGPLDRTSATPPPEVFRLDGTETQLRDAATGVALDITHRFALVADMLALTVKQPFGGTAAGYTQVTDALAVDGDILTLHRQLTSVTGTGTIRTMTEPTNNFRHTYVYRRVG